MKKEKRKITHAYIIHRVNLLIYLLEELQKATKGDTIPRELLEELDFKMLDVRDILDILIKEGRN